MFRVVQVAVELIAETVGTASALRIGIEAFNRYMGYFVNVHDLR